MAPLAALDVAAAELDRVHRERRDLVQRDALLPPVGEGIRVGIRGEARVAEPAEEAHHREVELAVATVRGGIDQPVATVGVDQPVAGPQVAVQACGRFRGTADSFQAPGQSLHRRDRRVRQRARITRQPGEREQPVSGVELGPRRARFVGQPAAAGAAPVFAAEAGRARAVQRRKCGAEWRFGRAARPAAFVDPLQHEVVRCVVGDREHLGDRDRAGCAQPGEPGGLGGEEVRRRGRVGLREHTPAVVEVERERDRNVSAVHTGVAR